MGQTKLVIADEHVTRAVETVKRALDHPETFFDYEDDKAEMQFTMWLLDRIGFQIEYSKPEPVPINLVPVEVLETEDRNAIVIMLQAQKMEYLGKADQYERLGQMATSREYLDQVTALIGMIARIQELPHMARLT